MDTWREDEVSLTGFCVGDVNLVRLPTPLWRIISMAVTTSCVTGREMLRPKNNLNNYHAGTPGDRVYGQT